MRKMATCMLIILFTIGIISGCAINQNKNPGERYVGSDYIPQATNMHEKDSEGNRIRLHDIRQIINNGGPMVEDYGIGLYRLRLNSTGKNDGKQINDISNRIRNLPNVDDVTIVNYADNILIGVATNQSVNTISKRIMYELHEEAKYNQIYITTNPELFRKIAEVEQRILKKQPVAENELRQLVTIVGREVAPNNYKY